MRRRPIPRSTPPCAARCALPFGTRGGLTRQALAHSGRGRSSGEPRGVVRQLELLGLAADTANDGVEALEAWAAGRGQYAAVLADIHMPRMDGHELTRQIRPKRRKVERPPCARDRCSHRQCDEGRGRTLPCGRHGCLFGQAVNMDQLRTNVERWIQVDDVSRDTADAPDAPKPPSAIDRDVLAAWLATMLRRSTRCWRNSAIPRSRPSARSLGLAQRRPAGAGRCRAQSSKARRRPSRHRRRRRRRGAGAGGKAGDRTRCREGLGPLAAELRRARRRDRPAPVGVTKH